MMMSMMIITVSILIALKKRQETEKSDKVTQGLAKELWHLWSHLYATNFTEKWVVHVPATNGLTQLRSE